MVVVIGAAVDSEAEAEVVEIEVAEAVEGEVVEDVADTAPAQGRSGSPPVRTLSRSDRPA